MRYGLRHPIRVALDELAAGDREEVRCETLQIGTCCRAGLAAGSPSRLPHPDAIGLAWLWVYLGAWVLFALSMAAIHPDLAPRFTHDSPRLERYAELWFGDHGGAATLQVALMAVQVLMVAYLWLRFRGLRRHRRIALGPYLVLAGLALLLLGLQQVFLLLSALDEPRLLLLPQLDGVPIPDPTPQSP